MPTSPRTLLAVLLIAALPIAAFWLGRPRALPPADFTFVLPKESSTVDPAQATSVSDGWIIQSLFDPLTRLDPQTLEPLPAAARSWQLSDDGRVYTFSIDPAGRWSDGRPVRAHDFVFAWRRVLDPATGSGFGFLLHGVTGASAAIAGEIAPERVGLESPDADTFVVRLAEPVPYFLSLASHFALSPVRSDLVERVGDRFTDPEHLVSNGPYSLQLRRVRDRIRLVAQPHHPRAADVALRVVDALAIDEDSTALNLYLTGGVDWVNAIPSNALPHLTGRPDLHLTTVLATNFLRFNVTRPPFDRVELRRAIDRALDRDSLCRFVYRGAERPAHSLVPPSLHGYEPAAGVDEDIAAAREALAAFAAATGVGPGEIELLHSADEGQRAVAEAIAARLRDALGLAVRPTPQEFRVYLDSQRKLRYQMCLTNWIGDYPDPSNFLELFRAGSSSNRTGWQDPRYDALLDRAAATRDPAERARRLREAEELLLADGPIAPISYRGQANLVNPAIVGFADNPLDLHPLADMRWREPR